MHVIRLSHDIIARLYLAMTKLEGLCYCILCSLVGKRKTSNEIKVHPAIQTFLFPFNKYRPETWLLRAWSTRDFMMSWKTLTETVMSGISMRLTQVIRMCGDSVRSAMRAASQLPGRKPTDVDDAPAPTR